MSNPEEVLEPLLESAREGDPESLGRLLELYRNYLRFLARGMIGGTLRVRLDASDLVQETFLEALRDFRQFAGGTEAQLMAWLRRILVRNLADQVKRHQAQGRDCQRQQSLEALLSQSAGTAQQALSAGISTPSAQAARKEETVLLAEALACLPADYREVVLLRHVERLKFEEIAGRLGRSAGAVRMLWVRALENLHTALEASRGTER